MNTKFLSLLQVSDVVKQAKSLGYSTEKTLEAINQMHDWITSNSDDEDEIWANPGISVDSSGKHCVQARICSCEDGCVSQDVNFVIKFW